MADKKEKKYTSPFADINLEEFQPEVKVKENINLEKLTETSEKAGFPSREPNSKIQAPETIKVKKEVKVRPSAGSVQTEWLSLRITEHLKRQLKTRAIEEGAIRTIVLNALARTGFDITKDLEVQE